MKEVTISACAECKEKGVYLVLHARLTYADAENGQVFDDERPNFLFITSSVKGIVAGVISINALTKDINLKTDEVVLKGMYDAAAATLYELESAKAYVPQEAKEAILKIAGTIGTWIANEWKHEEGVT